MAAAFTTYRRTAICSAGRPSARAAGAERSAYVTVDRLGAPRAAGGMCVTLRDLARVGQWLIDEKSDWLAALEVSGDPKAWAAGDLAQYYPRLPMRYRSQ